MVVRAIALVSILALAGTPSLAEIETGDCLILPSATIDLGGTVPGLIAEVNVEIGDSVEKGQIVASLRTEVQETVRRLAILRAENRTSVTAAETQLEFERYEFERIRDLRERGVATETQLIEREAAMVLREAELEDALAQARAAEIEVERAETELEVRRLRAPVSGVVADRYLDGGEYLRDDGRVVTIVQLNPLRVEIFLPQLAYPAIAVGDIVPITPELGAPGPFDAEVRTKDPMVDAASASFRVRLDLANPGGAIISGTRCSAVFTSVTLSDG